MSVSPVVEALIQVALRRQLLARDRSGLLRDLLAEASTPAEVREDLECITEPEAKVLAELLPDDDLLLTAPYVRHACLGQGRLGTTWLGTAPDGSRCVIKLVHPHRVAPGSGVELLVRDMQPLIGATLTYLVPYRSIFVAADGRAALVQDYIAGRDLQQRMEMKGPMLEARALVAARQMTKALGELEQLGVLHGLLHPGNVLLDEHHRAHVNDYGLAFGRTLQALRQGLAPADLLLHAWSAPETQSPTPRLLPASDLYSVGCLTYWLLAGESPFTGPSDRQAAQHRGGARPDVRNLAPDTSEITAKTILKCMQIDPARRYARVGDLGRSLQRNLQRLLPDEKETGVHPVDAADSAELSLALDEHSVPTAEVASDASALAPRSIDTPASGETPVTEAPPPVAKPLDPRPQLRLDDD